MTGEVRIAVIGSGRMAAVHARNIGLTDGATLAAVAGGSGAAALAAGHRVPVRSLDEVFVDPGVEAVVIASPNRFHAEQVVAAARGGKAVLVEKPVDLDLARVDECIEAVGADGAGESRVVVAFNRRFDASFAAVRERVRDGEVGAVEQLVIVSRDPAPPPLEYVPGSGGHFLDMTIHDLDMARFLVGEIVDVRAVSQAVDPALATLGDASGAVVTLTAASGALVTIVNARHNASGYDQRLEVFGAAGTLRVANPSRTLVRASNGDRVDVADPLIGHYGDRYAQAYRAEIAHLVAVARRECVPRATLRDGREALVLALAADRAAAGGGVGDSTAGTTAVAVAVDDRAAAGSVTDDLGPSSAGWCVGPGMDTGATGRRWWALGRIGRRAGRFAAAYADRVGDSTRCDRKDR